MFVSRKQRRNPDRVTKFFVLNGALMVIPPITGEHAQERAISAMRDQYDAMHYPQLRVTMMDQFGNYSTIKTMDEYIYPRFYAQQENKT